MNGWIIALVVFVVFFIILVLLRMDWGEFFGEDTDFMGKLRKIGDACCLGSIMRKR